MKKYINKETTALEMLKKINYKMVGAPKENNKTSGKNNKIFSDDNYLRFIK